MRENFIKVNGKALELCTFLKEKDSLAVCEMARLTDMDAFMTAPII